MTDVTSSGAIDVVAVSGGVGFPSSTRRLTDSLLTAVEQAAAEPQGAVATRTVEEHDRAVDVADATVARLPSPRLAEALAEGEGRAQGITARPYIQLHGL